MKQLRGFKFRFFPNSSQRLQLAQTFGCSRFVFNWALDLKSVSYKKNGESISYNQTSKLLTQLKKEESTTWLKMKYLSRSENGNVLAATLGIKEMSTRH